MVRYFYSHVFVIKRVMFVCLFVYGSFLNRSAKNRRPNNFSFQHVESFGFNLTLILGFIFTSVTRPNFWSGFLNPSAHKAKTNTSTSSPHVQYIPCCGHSDHVSQRDAVLPFQTRATVGHVITCGSAPTNCVWSYS